jgi:hypothetical protein
VGEPRAAARAETDRPQTDRRVVGRMEQKGKLFKRNARDASRELQAVSCMQAASASGASCASWRMNGSQSVSPFQLPAPSFQARFLVSPLAHQRIAACAQRAAPPPKHPSLGRAQAWSWIAWIEPVFPSPSSLWWSPPPAPRPPQHTHHPVPSHPVRRLRNATLNVLWEGRRRLAVK